ncbi:OprO/OprP family phosphate-selective porin [Limimonas halophila]|uniref:OprO/OprP family phosphate-selective porin n=1 Tax=Limimonas halophila TaxID=1082479 RepID=UPI0015A4D1C4|nr:porin [Limimonas halophila]
MGRTRLAACLVVAGLAGVSGASAQQTDDGGDRAGWPSVAPYGLVALDAGAFTGAGTPDRDDGEVRRALIGVRASHGPHLGLEAAYDPAAEDTPWKNVFATLDVGGVLLAAGNQKPPFSMQFQQELPHLMFPERGLPFGLSPRRRVGVSANVAGELWQAQAGVFGSNLNDGVEFDTPLVGARATYTPIRRARTTLHLGGAVNHTDADGRAAFGFPPETLLAREPLVASGPMPGTTGFTRGNLELAGTRGPVSVQGEYHLVAVDRAGADAVFRGGYVQAAWLLTGETRPYVHAKGQMRRGMLGRPRAAAPVGPTAGGTGAWEVAARVSTLDLRDDGVGRGDGRTFSLALTWFANPHARVTASYVNAHADGAGGGTIHAGLLRLQGKF